MICVCRLSLSLLNQIEKYVKTHKTLTFIEALIPTLCFKNKLNFKTDEKFNSIIWRKKYMKEKIDKISFFHPVKECNLHYEFRNI